MSAIKPLCPKCGSQHTVKNGRIHNKKRKYKCQNCGRQFVESPSNKVVSQETKELIDKLLLEKISLAGRGGFGLIDRQIGFLVCPIKPAPTQLASQKNGCKIMSTLSIERFPGK